MKRRIHYLAILFGGSCMCAGCWIKEGFGAALLLFGFLILVAGCAKWMEKEW